MPKVNAGTVLGIFEGSEGSFCRLSWLGNDTCFWKDNLVKQLLWRFKRTADFRNRSLGKYNFVTAVCESCRVEHVSFVLFTPPLIS